MVLGSRGCLAVLYCWRGGPCGRLFVPLEVELDSGPDSSEPGEVQGACVGGANSNIPLGQGVERAWASVPGVSKT